MTGHVPAGLLADAVEHQGGVTQAEPGEFRDVFLRDRRPLVGPSERQDVRQAHVALAEHRLSGERHAGVEITLADLVHDLGIAAVRPDDDSLLVHAVQAGADGETGTDLADFHPPGPQLFAHFDHQVSLEEDVVHQRHLGDPAPAQVAGYRVVLVVLGLRARPVEGSHARAGDVDVPADLQARFGPEVDPVQRDRRQV